MRYLIFMAMIALMSCKSSPQQTTEQNAVQEVVSEGKMELLSGEEFKGKMDALTENNEAFTLLDVRTPAELQADGYLENSININFNDADFAAQISHLDKDIPLFVYCRSGGRSGKSCAILSDLGFKEVYDLDGGIIQWKADGKPVVNE